MPRTSTPSKLQLRHSVSRGNQLDPRAGLIACGNGYQFAASDTKGHALALPITSRRVSRWTSRSTFTSPAAIIPARGVHRRYRLDRHQGVEGDDEIEGYNVHVGGGYGDEQALAREVFRYVKAVGAPQVIERMLMTYLAQRIDVTETINSPAARHPEQLQSAFNIQEGSGMMALLPENAPFSQQQRAWLNGVFRRIAGLEQMTGGATSLRLRRGAGRRKSTRHGTIRRCANGRRMALAEGKPLKWQLMAAMGQLDCGQCGYQCDAYAAVIADGSERDLTKCVPGSKPVEDHQTAVEKITAGRIVQ